MSEKKKILIFIDWFLPGYKAGGPIRSVANLVEHLSGEFEFKIITSNTDYLENEPYKNIQSNEWNKFAENVFVYYFSKDKLSIKNFKKIIRKTDFDIVYINGMYSFYFSILPLIILRKANKKKVVASRGMLSQQSFSSKSIKKIIFLKFAKLLNLYRDITFQATDKKEAEDISNILKNYKGIITIPNLPQKVVYYQNKLRDKKPGTLKLISIARISNEKNTLFALEILKKSDYKGEIDFDLFGSIYNNEYWNKCQKIIESLPENITVNYKGSIESSKVHETFSNYHFSFMPSKGENFGHSIFEALSAGCPVIISDQTPWRNLEEKNIGWDIALNDEVKFIDTIQKCIDMSQDEYDVMSLNAYYFAVNFNKNSKAIEQTKKMFRQ